MSLECVTAPADSSAIAQLTALAPASPFATAAYFQAMQQLGHSAFVLSVCGPDGWTTGCGLFLRRGRLNTSLQIVSLPDVRNDSIIWAGLHRFCTEHRITDLLVGTFGSPPGAEIPVLSRHDVVRQRCEFVIDLVAAADLPLSSHHRRVVKKATQAGLIVAKARSAAVFSTHQALMEQSLSRRRQRGEAPPSENSSRDARAFLSCGAAEIFQATRDGTPLSSVLVLRSATGAYYHSAGTSPDGMAIGASHFLISQVARELRGEGVCAFNLGGADPESSLARFKEGFGARRVPLAEVRAYLGSGWRRCTTELMQLAAHDRTALAGRLTGRIACMRTYAVDTAAARAPVSATLSIRALAEKDLRSLANADGDFRARQLARLARLGKSYAYAVMYNERLAHISWMLPAGAAAMDPPRVFKLRAREAEITACETLPEFRGKGAYRFAIESLIAAAARTGIRRVFMKANATNRGSWTAIEHAGVKRLGIALIITPPLIGSQWMLRVSRFRAGGRAG
jgi:RimJ/RimL family protein N-acetyltransferase